MSPRKPFNGNAASGAPRGACPAGSATPHRVRSTELLGASGQLIIEHDGREYRLRVTNNGKLILTA